MYSETSKEKYCKQDYPDFYYTQFHIEHSSINYDFPIHTHDFTEAVIICSGQCNHIVKDKIYPIKGGDVFVIKGNTPHGFFDVDHLEIINLMFDSRSFFHQENQLYTIAGFQPLFITEPELRIYGEYPYMLSIDADELSYVVALTDMIIKQSSMNHHENILHIKLLFLSIIAYLSAQYTVHVHHSHKIRLLSEAIQYMENHLEQDLSVAEIAECCYISQRQLERIFSTYYHISPIEYLTELRLEHAYHLITKEQFPIAKAAGMCGFSNASYFSRIFKKHYGFSPSQITKFVL